MACANNQQLRLARIELNMLSLANNHDLIEQACKANLSTYRHLPPERCIKSLPSCSKNLIDRQLGFRLTMSNAVSSR
jgi:hypothetical protein